MRFERGRVSVAILVVGCLVVGCDGPPPPLKERAGATGHAAEVVALAYTPDGQSLVSRGADSIRVWDAATLAERASFPSDRADFGALAISPDGQTLAGTWLGRGVVTWNLAERAEQTVFRVNPAATADPDASPQAFGWGLAYAPDGRTLAGPSEDRAAPSSIYFWDPTTHRATGIGPPGQPATHLAFTPDGRRLVAKAMEGSIRVWDVATRTEQATVAASSSYLASLAVSPDGKTMAAAGDDRYLRIWAVDSGAEVGKLRGHLKAILGVAFHPDGRHVVTGDSGGTIFLWDIPSQEVIAQFKGHQGKVWALAFRPDGKELASAGEDRRVRVWDAAQAIAKYGR